VPDHTPESTTDRADGPAYRSLFDSVSDAVIVHDPETGAIVEVNERFCDLFGYSRAEALDLSVSAITADDWTPPVSAEERIQQAREEGTVAFDWKDQRSDGSTLWVEVELRLAEIDGDDRVVASLRDLSDARRRQFRLRRLHEATRDLLAAESRVAAAAVVSDAATEILDFPVNGVHLYDPDDDALVPVAVSEPMTDALGEPPALRSGAAWRAYQRGETAAYDDVRTADVHNPDTPMRSEIVLPIGDHGVLIAGSERVGDFDDTDVTLAEVLAANAAGALTRIENRRSLQRHNDRLERFASIVSHDLRDPLNTAKAATAVARRGDETALDDVAESLDRMEAIVEDVLTLTRQETTVDATEAVDLGCVAADAWSTAGDDGAALVVDGSPTVEADRSRLLRLVENLFRNSVEHGATADGAAADVTVSVGALADGAGFYVADDGPGIPAEERDEAFERGHSTSSTGTGLGLAIVAEVAAAHGWDRRLTESETGGVRFEFETGGIV